MAEKQGDSEENTVKQRVLERTVVSDRFAYRMTDLFPCRVNRQVIIMIQRLI